MSIAVALPLDDAASARIAATWDRLARRGISDSMPRLGYRPHVTLAVFDALDETAADAALAALAATQQPWSGAFVGIGAFEAPRPVLWARPAVDTRLVALQAKVVAALAMPCHPHYGPDVWVPHCTLADGLSAAALTLARELVADADVAGPVRYASLELVRFPPVDIRARWSFAG